MRSDTKDVLVTPDGRVHLLEVTPTGAIFWPPRPRCGQKLENATTFWGRLLWAGIVTHCRLCYDRISENLENFSSSSS